MKYIYIFSTIALLCWVSCSKIDDSYKNYIVPGGRVYVEKANEAIALPGYYKVDIVWPKAADPNVTSAKIFWNNYTDSLAVTINLQQDTVNAEVTGLAEQYYTFVIITYDKNGNSSVPVEVTGRSIGDNYLSSLSNRHLQSAFQTSGILTLKWGAAAVYNGEIGVELSFTDTSGNHVKWYVPNDETNTIISNYADTTHFTYRTLFKADSSAIDTLYTAYATVKDIKLDKSKWQVIAFSSAHPGPENAASNLIDGTYHTRWHTFFPSSTYPHWVVVDMGVERTITKFSVERTDKDVPAGDDRGPDVFQLLQSNDATTWTDMGTFNFNRLANGEQIFTIASPIKTRYFKFVGISGAVNYMVLGEVSAYGF